jgi:DNA-binding NarL/FixJ family response regulator
LCDDVAMTHVLLVDDHALFREAVRALLRTSDVRVTEAQDGRSAIRMAEDLSPDVVVMDLMMPDMNGIDATRHLVEARRQVKVLVLSAQLDRRSIRDALAAGAAGYLPKDAAFEELVNAISVIMAGQVYISSRVAGAVRDELLSATRGTVPGAPRREMTQRERAVLQLLAEGWSTKEVARQLGIGVKTAETHRRNLLEKLHMQSIAELTKYALREGIATL